jgi:hypothetical protein
MTKKYGIEHFYELHGRNYICSYCGDAAETIDHCLPQSHVHKHRRAYIGFIILKTPSCQHCNSILGDKIFNDFAARKAHVNKKLCIKFKKELAFLAWDEDEMKEMGPGLRKRIEIGRVQAGFAARRVYFSSVASSMGVPNEIILRRIDSETIGQKGEVA